MNDTLNLGDDRSQLIDKAIARYEKEIAFFNETRDALLLWGEITLATTYSRLIIETQGKVNKLRGLEGDGSGSDELAKALANIGLGDSNDG